MRLLNTTTLELRFFMPSTVPDYVILSHRWLPLPSLECTFSDLSTPNLISQPSHPARLKIGFAKLQGACNLALKDGYSWIWIDSCCIDKSSSAELQEAINSMWKYYAEANICYAYLSDVEDGEAGWGEAFKKSDWFRRGWTLQELIAPGGVEFYAEDWTPIGTKSERYEEIAGITEINAKILVRKRKLSQCSVAERLSWAAHRSVTRDEDEAYSLLGLFEVNIPLLYGEGRERAFVRLQEAIYIFTTDHSILLFRHSLYSGNQPLLADSPTRFCDRRDCKLCLSSGIQTVQCLPSHIRYRDIRTSKRWGTQAHEQIMTTVTPARNEMSTVLPLLDYQEISSILSPSISQPDEPLQRGTHLAVLNSSLKKHETGAFCLWLLHSQAANGAFKRLRCFPLFLPNLGALEGKLQNTKVLICSGLGKLTQDLSAITAFVINRDCFLVLEWDLKYCLQHGLPILSADGSIQELQVQTNDLASSVNSSKILWHFLDPQEPSWHIYLWLIMLGRAWSIKVVSQSINTLQSEDTQVLFRSNYLTDRCSVQISKGRWLSFSLRRMPAACRAQNGDSVLEYRYQIGIKYL